MKRPFPKGKKRPFRCMSSGYDLKFACAFIGGLSDAPLWGIQNSSQNPPCFNMGFLKIW